ncbi:hypothetical protein [Candidatus Methanocrinis natronophilus]|uniref:Aerotolerance regulator N-terminal domain-containing protein n=1 Tax=Candidatus Methanocrinis natronophilus TaxID=3033396 RepID=A0ABT5XAK8_9EURY|nr:hypothetical protein [Candidatus Methanocrinis natronophilus]MDF0591715.1 hypothetical protein [Candidatus Methanocrinis natronophilus]
MLTLLATVAGSMITGYSAYKILTIRKGRDRKLRDMEVLRRLNMPPKKQARVWSVLMVLGIVLLTPGLGLLLSNDPVSWSVGGRSPSDMRVDPGSGRPVMVPPTEKLDKTPRMVERDESGRSASPAFFVSSGGGKSSYSGGVTAPDKPSDVIVSAVDERSLKVEGADPRADAVRAPPAVISEIGEAPEVLITPSAQATPRIEREPEKTERARSGGYQEPKVDNGEVPETAPANVPPADGGQAIEEVKPVQEEKTAFQRGSSHPDPGSPSASSLPLAAVVDVGPEKKTSPEIFGPFAALSSPEPISKTPPAEPVVIEIDPEREGSLDRSGHQEVGDLYESDPTIDSTDPVDFEVELDLSEPPTSPGSVDEGGELDPDLSENSSEDAQTVEPVLATELSGEADTGRFKRLVFMDDPSGDPGARDGDSGELRGLSNGSISNMTNASGGIGIGPSPIGFDGGLGLGREFNGSWVPFQLGAGTDRGDVYKQVSLIEFEKMDFRSNFHGGFGFTPTSLI